MSTIETKIRLRTLQRIQLELLCEVDRICKKHSIRYQLFSGTLLGCIRHRGFIPWDDDIDLCMPREDYEKFLVYAKEELDERMFLQTTTSDPEYLLQFAKIRMNDTLMIEANMANLSIHHGIFIDIFPFDKIAPSGLKRSLQRLFLQSLRFAELARSNEILQGSNRIPSFMVNRIHRLALRIPKVKLDKLQDRLLTWFNERRELSLCHLTNGVTTQRIRKFICNEDRFFESIEGEFERLMFPIPRDAELLLRQQYGDYMLLPPKSQRHSMHRVQEISVNRMSKVKPYRIGYTSGVFDYYHLGHQNFLKQAKDCCDILIVGINRDDLTLEYKGLTPTWNESQRAQMVKEGGYADQIILVDTLDKTEAYRKFKFNVLLIGDDWKGHPRWIQTQLEMEEFGVDVVYLPYTQGISSTKIRQNTDFFMNST